MTDSAPSRFFSNSRPHNPFPAKWWRWWHTCVWFSIHRMQFPTNATVQAEVDSVNVTRAPTSALALNGASAYSYEQLKPQLEKQMGIYAQSVFSSSQPRIQSQLAGAAYDASYQELHHDLHEIAARKTQELVDKDSMVRLQQQGATAQSQSGLVSGQLPAAVTGAVVVSRTRVAVGGRRTRYCPAHPLPVPAEAALQVLHVRASGG